MLAVDLDLVDAYAGLVEDEAVRERVLTLVRGICPTPNLAYRRPAS